MKAISYIFSKMYFYFFENYSIIVSLSVRYMLFYDDFHMLLRKICNTFCSLKTNRKERRKATMKSFCIQENDSCQRLDRFLQKAMPDIPKSALYKWIRTKKIKVNQKRCTPEQRLCVGDQVTIFVQDAFLSPTSAQPEKESLEFLQAPESLDILFENKQILLVCKPVGLVVHTDHQQTPDTLINRILHYLYRSGAYQPEQEHSFKPALCNRLDRNTGGIVIAAKTAEALREVNRLIRNNQIQKRYLCITVGTPEPKAAVLHAWHKKSESHNTVTIQDTKAEGFQKIVTKYQVLENNDRRALLLVDLVTGRTHQIRAHLAHIGTPILGDTKYGNLRENRCAHCKYQQLWAYQIAFSTDADTCLTDLDGMVIQTETPDFVTREFPQINLSHAVT